MERLDCTCNNYAWGKYGEDSEVARLYAAGHPQFQTDGSKPYSELWMGTHPDGPARVRDSSERLSRVIARSESAQLLNNNNKRQTDEIHLPFIMKIMSIRHTLSLQVHPTKEQASELHERDPKNYPDRNHKPELAYALTKFELLCGFRPATEIVENMRAFPELRKVMGEANCERFESLVEDGEPQDSDIMKDALKRCFSATLYMDASTVEEQLRSFSKKLSRGVRGCLIEDTIPVLFDMLQRFPGDVGCFSPLYLNHMILQPGECCFYAAQELHAYLSGECVECVGCSNNTIRAAMTPKYIDREALVAVLNWRMTEPSYYLVPPRPLPQMPHVLEYAPECKDFQLHQVELHDDPARCRFPAELPVLDCASIIVIVEGEGVCEDTECSSFSETQSLNGSSSVRSRHVKRGDIFYIPPNCSVRFKELVNGYKRLLAYRTYSYEVGPDHSNRKTAVEIVQPAKDVVQLKIEARQKQQQQQQPVRHVPRTAAVTTRPMPLWQRATFGIERDEIFSVDSEMDGFA
ncbi:Protein C05C8.7 [Aphelenchoides avenae]|nr:Protein C05C8.7 [Aphelenchus avenae]